MNSIKFNFCPHCGKKHSYKTKDNLCKKHYHQLKRFGKFLDNNPRTKYDPNGYEVLGLTTRVELYEPITWNTNNHFIIDTEDLPIILRYKWSLNNKGYVKTEGHPKEKLLHRILLQAIKGSTVDHIDRNTLNNTKDNLRITSRTVNSINRNAYNKLGVKGVEKTKSGKYSAYFRIYNKQYHSPLYNTIGEAAFARYIIEQMFCKEYIPQSNMNLYKDLSQERKEEIINKLRVHFKV